MPKQEKCPHCGYCPHCGRSDAVKTVPYPVPYPVAPWPRPVPPWQPTWISQPTTITCGTGNIGVSPRENQAAMH